MKSYLLSSPFRTLPGFLLISAADPGMPFLSQAVQVCDKKGHFATMLSRGLNTVATLIPKYGKRRT
jgi:hypothetical protein